MDFTWTEEQTELRVAAAEYAQRELNHDMVTRDRTSAFAPALWQKAARFGVQGLPFPKEYGGGGVSLLTAVHAMEGIGFGCRDNGLVFAMNAQMWSVQHPISAFGSDDQKRRYLPGLCDGTLIGAHGMTEPGSGSDAFALRTRFAERDGGYVLNGSKTFVTNAPHADLAIVFATSNAELGQWGVSAFIVERGTPGFQTGVDIEKMGLRTAPLGELILDDCFIPAENRLGPLGAGAAIFGDSMEWERTAILASNIGVMERQLEDCVRYAKERTQFGKPIGTFQSVSNRIADMEVRLEASRLLLYKAAWLKSAGKPAGREAAIAKLFLSESFVQSSHDAIRIHGGYGYAAESEVERDLRDAIGGTLYSGTSDLQRVIIAGRLGLT
jgi:alkylation response protein AidB-like acyl-CoA dehydrogenase